MNIRNWLVVTTLITVVIFASVSVAGQSQVSKTRFSLKLASGGIYHRMGDFNNHMESISSLLTSGTSRGLSTESIALLSNWTGIWEVEARIEIWKKLGFGISISSPRHSEQDASVPLFSVFDPEGTTIGTFSSIQSLELRSPLRWSLYYSIPVLSKLSLVINGGIGLYAGKMSEVFNYDIVDIFGAGWYRTNWVTDWKSALGFHGGIGADYTLNRRLILVAEFRYQRVNVSDFSATMNSESNLWPYGFYYDSEGKLYAWGWGEDGPLGPSYGELIVWQGTPPMTGGTMGSYARGKAFLDLSGLSLTVGIRVGLF